MSSYEERAARRYREHAEELRTIADHEGHERTRQTLKRIAADYDDMAVTMDTIDQTNRESLGKRYSG